ncbi:MAG: hypothetical protein FJY81_02645 [Candidatus Aminicenantes bacterium]|nr:hypothetical protein [Candidatus Aminicenantes bacterium]
MSRLESRVAVLIYLVLTFGVALYLGIYIQSARFTILDHSFRLDSVFFLLWAGVSAIVLLAWIFVARREARALSVSQASRLRAGLLASLPLSLFLLAPLLLRFYTTRDDLRGRLRLLAIFIVLAILFLKFAGYARLRKKKLSLLDRLTDKFSSLSLRRRLALLFFAAFLLYQAAAAILVLQGESFTGDEPFYLMTSHSLLRDGDINLANNYANQDYFAFYSKKEHPKLKLWPYGRYGRKGKDTIYPINLPGISVLMLPFYWLSQLFSGRWLTFILKTSLSPWAVLLGLQIYLYAREHWGREKLALGLWAVFSLSSPVLFYAVHLYPEVPIALFSFYVFRKVSSRGALPASRLVFLGFVLGLFPWFGLKYNFLFWPLLLISTYFLLKEHPAKARVLAFLALPLISTALFYFFIFALYGTFSPLAVYEGVMTPDQVEAFKQTVLSIPLRARVDAFLDYFLDQRDGLLLYSPVYFFVFLGLVEIFRRRRRDFWFLLFLSLPYLLNYAFFTHRQGASPQGRVLTPLSWIAAISLGYFLVHNRRQIFSFLFGVAAAAGFAVAGLLLAHPSFLYQPTTHEYTSRPGELFVHLSNLHFFLPPFLPSFIKVDNTRYWPNYTWILAGVLFVAAYAFIRKEKPLSLWFPAAFAGCALVASFFLWVLYPQTPLYPAKTIRYSSQKALGFYLFPIGKGVVSKDSGDFYLHFEKRYKFLFGSRTELDRVKLVFGSDKGDYSVRLALFDIPVFEGRTAFEIREFAFEPAACYRFRNLFLYEINLSLAHHSTESMLIDPFLLQVLPW